MTIKPFPVWGPYEGDLDGFVYPIPKGKRRAIHVEPNGQVTIYARGRDAPENVSSHFRGPTMFWVHRLAEAIMSTSATLCGLDADRQTMQQEGVVIEVVISHSAGPKMGEDQHHDERWWSEAGLRAITALWAIPAGAWERGRDNKDLSIRLAQMRSIVQQAGFTDLAQHPYPAIRTTQLIPPNPWNPACGLAEGCRSFPATSRQIDYVLWETEMAPLVIDHAGFWSRKSKAVRLASKEDAWRCRPQIDDVL